MGDNALVHTTRAKDKTRSRGSIHIGHDLTQMTQHAVDIMRHTWAGAQLNNAGSYLVSHVAMALRTQTHATWLICARSAERPHCVQFRLSAWGHGGNVCQIKNGHSLSNGVEHTHTRQHHISVVPTRLTQTI